jgi:hypothetical protein
VFFGLCVLWSLLLCLCVSRVSEDDLGGQSAAVSGLTNVCSLVGVSSPVPRHLCTQHPVSTTAAGCPALCRCPADTSSSVRDQCILWSLTRPEQADLVAAVNEAAAANDTGKPGVLGGLLDQWQKTRQK